jgi:hypothetical protein
LTERATLRSSGGAEREHLLKKERKAQMNFSFFLSKSKERLVATVVVSQLKTKQNPRYFELYQ